jgi:hypothetical protein
MTRDQKLIALFASLALICCAAVGTQLASQGPPPVPVISEELAVGSDGRVSVQFVGETMLGGAFPALATQRGPSYDWPFDALRSSFSSSTYVVAAAGAAFTDSAPPVAPASAVFDVAQPPTAHAMARAGIDALMLATDSVSKSGPRGLADTMHHAEAAGMSTIGAGADLARAEQPLLLRTDIGTIGLVGLGEGMTTRADLGIPGTMAMTREAVVRGADLAHAAGADWIVGLVHWGKSYTPFQSRQRYLAQAFARAGYDLVVGTGSHFAEPIEIIDGMPVAYSTGNFVYGTNGRFKQFGVPGYGLSVGLDLDPHGGPLLTVRCLLTDNKVVAFQPRPCTAAETAAFLPTLNPELRVDGDRAVLRCNACFPRRGTQ